MPTSPEAPIQWLNADNNFPTKQGTLLTLLNAEKAPEFISNFITPPEKPFSKALKSFSIKLNSIFKVLLLFNSWMNFQLKSFKGFEKLWNWFVRDFDEEEEEEREALSSFSCSLQNSILVLMQMKCYVDLDWRSSAGWDEFEKFPAPFEGNKLRLQLLPLNSGFWK